MKAKTNFKAGDECLYEDFGTIIRCKILEYSIESGWLKVTLKVLAVFRENFILEIKSIKPGTIFYAEKQVHYHIPGLWSMTPAP